MPKRPVLTAICSCLCCALFSSAGAGAEPALFDPFTGYRIAAYRAPIPAAPEGIPTVATHELPALIEAGALLLDVHPLRSFRIAGDGAWIHPELHRTLPDATWLPVVGWGVIEGWAEDYLHDSLSRLAAPGRPVIVFCQTDCWLSWNAVQRVRSLGYDARWYPGGVDDWQAAGFDLVPSEPLPVPLRE